MRKGKEAEWRLHPLIHTLPIFTLAQDVGRCQRGEKKPPPTRGTKQVGASTNCSHRPAHLAAGAGIAGLSAVHELAQLGYTVSVYEAFDQPGGFLRSSRLSIDNTPSEYSWHGMGPWYHNAFDLVQ